MVTLVTTLRRLMFLPAEQCKAHTGPSSGANKFKTIKTRSSPASGGAVPARCRFQAAATKLELQEQPLARCEVHVQRNRGLRLRSRMRAGAKSKGEGHLLGRGSNCFFGTGCNTQPPIIGGCIFPKAAGWAACDCAAAGLGASAADTANDEAGVVACAEAGLGASVADAADDEAGVVACAGAACAADAAGGCCCNCSSGAS